MISGRFFTKGLCSRPETRRTPSAHVWLVSTRNDIQRDWLDNDSQRLVRLLSYCVPEIGSGGAGGITSQWLTQIMSPSYLSRFDGIANKSFQPSVLHLPKD